MQTRCSGCGKILSVPDGAQATHGKCPHCNKVVDIEGAERVGLGPGDVVGDFRVDALIGRGGMATVYRGTQLSLDRPVAIKVLAPQLARRSRFVERFQREAKLLAQLSHHNIVGVLVAGTHDDFYYLVMELVEGESLRERLRREGKIPFAEAARLIDGVAAGLEYAHNHDVLHRDIKPANILITREGVPKIADFGIARLLGRETDVQRRLTMARTRMGSAHYMAPEQMKDAASVDHRADVYALGVMFYEMLTGELPIGQFKPASRLAQGVPLATDRIIRQALATQPDERFQTVARFRALVQRLSLTGLPTRLGAPRRTGQPRAARQRPPRRKKLPLPLLIGLGATVAAALLIVVLALGRSGRKPPQAIAPPPGPRTSPPRVPAVTPPPKHVGPPTAPPGKTVEPPMPAGDWVSLFDGKSLDGWQKVWRFHMPRKYGSGKSGEATLAPAKQCVILELGDPISGIHCKTKMPTTNYEVELEAASADGEKPAFRVVFPLGGTHCTLAVTGGEVSHVGLELVDSKSMADNGTAASVDLDPAKWHRLRLRVTDAKVVAWMNGQQVVEQSREGHDLNRSVYYRHVQNLGLCARGARPAFRNVRFRRLRAARAMPAGP